MPGHRPHLISFSFLPFAAVAAALLPLLAATPTARAAERPSHVSEKEEIVNEGIAPPASPADGIDRSTPKRAWASLIGACRNGRPELGVHLLNLGDVPPADRATLGATLARQLCEVLAASGRLTDGAAADLDDTATGPVVADKPVNYVVPFTVEVPGGGGAEEFWLRRTHDTKSDQHLWVATRYSVSLVPGWYQIVVKKERTVRPDADRLNEGLGALPADWRLETPRDAVAQFQRLARDGAYADAGRLLDLTTVPAEKQKAEAPRLARRLGLMLERLRPAGYGLLSNDPHGAPENDVPIDEEVVASTVVDGHPEQLRLARYSRASGHGAWLFSPATVASVDAVYHHVGYGWVGDHLPPVFFGVRLWNVQLWQWVGLLAAIVLALLVGFVAGFIARAVLRRVTKLTSWEWDDQLVHVVREPLALLFATLAFAVALEALALAERPEQVALAITKLVAILGAGWLGIRLIDVAGDAMTHFFRGRHDDLATAMVPVFRKVLKPIAAVIVGIVALQNVGMNVAGLLAGLGIGGIAIALAGKSALENLFGSIAIAFDRPFKIGDFVKVGDFTGTIEDVGLRSTRIRTLDRTLVTIPNGQMADAKVENYSARDRMKLAATIALQYETTLDQLRLIIDETKRYLVAHSQIWPDGISVRFVGHAPASLQIEIFCYVATPDWNTFTGIRETVFMDVRQIIERAGAQFAFPTQTVFLGKESAATPSEKAQQAAALVAQRRDAGELSIPEMPPALREQLRKKGA